MTLLILYGQIMVASFLFYVIWFVRNKRFKEAGAGGDRMGWLISFISISVFMACFWFVYTPLIIFKGDMFQEAIADMMIEATKRKKQKQDNSGDE